MSPPKTGRPLIAKRVNEVKPRLAAYGNPWQHKVLMPVYKQFLKTLETRYPQSARAVDLSERVSPLLLCPSTVQLNRSLLNEAQEIVRAFHELRELKERQERLGNLPPAIPDPGNESALMSYDFHVDEAGHLRLIEINTNASMALMTDLLYESKGLNNGITPDFRAEILNTFRSEFELALPSGDRKLERIAIVDEDPPKQRLYIEFLLYRELFERHGIAAEIADTSRLEFKDGELLFEGKRVDLVYNRDTDFYFETAATEALRAAFVARTACVTPNPHEYRLLADKERLMELSPEGAIDSLPISASSKNAVSQALIRTLAVNDFADKDELWSQRKRWFFKPKRSFGGKAAYRGSSIGHPVFKQIIEGDYLAQEFVPPGTMKASVDGTPEGPIDEFKYDLRFFAYRDRVQLACARLYKGQMTNTQTPGGGVAAIEWI